MKNLTANVIGATGLVGSYLVSLLLEDDRFGEVNVFTRRTTGIKHEKLKEHLVDFDKTGSWVEKLQGDVLFSSLGTTRKKAGNIKKQFLVDYTYQYAVAEAAAQQKVSDYVLISSAGANAKSKIFYSKIKGELDGDVRKLDFEKTIILRPSILDGQRGEQRGVEQLSLKIIRWLTRFVFKRYRPIHAQDVAKAMINSVFREHNKPSYSIYILDELFELAVD
ncbi:NAD(P)H-binding protein [uncultured Sunxiuqinia sp.]|uniref:NAD(P)H-binding protein n=1 Tax=uncultured Sunxiuqinia sp. TaxID=1573825 RepID=UPI002AA8CC41|nr:NAD(P)H-binding protein [uncultured Sunxiuqinia sp.]